MKNAQTELTLDIEVINEASSYDKPLAEKVRADHPKAVAALDRYREVYGQHVDAYRELCSALRDEKIEGKALTALLLDSGWSKQRASDFKTIIESPEVKFQAYIQKLVGFHAALANARDQSASGSRVLPVTTGRAYDAIANALNSVDTSVFMNRRAVFKIERLGMVYKIVATKKKGSVVVTGLKSSAKKKSHGAK